MFPTVQHNIHFWDTYIHDWEMEDEQRKRKEPEQEKGKEKEGPSDDGVASVPPKKRAKFDLQSRQLFLTYPQCNLEKEDALLQLSEKLGDPAEYIIAQEEHQVRAHPPIPEGWFVATVYINDAKQRADTLYQYTVAQLKNK